MSKEFFIEIDLENPARDAWNYQLLLRESISKPYPYEAFRAWQDKTGHNGSLKNQSYRDWVHELSNAELIEHYEHLLPLRIGTQLQKAAGHPISSQAMLAINYILGLLTGEMIKRKLPYANENHPKRC